MDTMKESLKRGRVGSIVSAACAILTAIYGVDIIGPEHQDIVNGASSFFSGLCLLFSAISKIRQKLRGV